MIETFCRKREIKLRDEAMYVYKVLSDQSIGQFIWSIREVFI